eukprot:753012-Hanusia_phi.AAC.9
MMLRSLDIYHDANITGSIRPSSKPNNSGRLRPSKLSKLCIVASNVTTSSKRPEGAARYKLHVPCLMVAQGCCPRLVPSSQLCLLLIDRDQACLLCAMVLNMTRQEGGGVREVRVAPTGMRSALKEAAEAAKEAAARRVVAVLKEIGYQSKEKDDDHDDDEGESQDLHEENQVGDWNYKGTAPSNWNLREWLREDVRLEDEISRFLYRLMLEKRESSRNGETGPIKRQEMGGLSEDEVGDLFEVMKPVLTSRICDAVRDLMEDPSSSSILSSSKCVLDASVLTANRDLGCPESNFCPAEKKLQLAAMQAEHCFSMDSDMLLRYEHSNTLLSTTPREEWETVAGTAALNFDGTFNLGSVPPQHGGGGQGGKGRSVASIQDLMQTSLVDLSDGRSLSEEEVIALRLWTGPMHLKYNAALTGQPHELASTLQGNSYRTTIQKIKSAMFKLAAHRKLTVERCFVVLDNCNELRKIDKTGKEEEEENGNGDHHHEKEEG